MCCCSTMMYCSLLHASPDRVAHTKLCDFVNYSLANWKTLHTTKNGDDNVSARQIYSLLEQQCRDIICQLHNLEKIGSKSSCFLIYLCKQITFCQCRSALKFWHEKLILFVCFFTCDKMTVKQLFSSDFQHLFLFTIVTNFIFFMSNLF